MKNFTADIVIGLEIHVELNTKTKLFCGCPTKGNEEPNTRTCVTCLGMPGSKPVLNKKAVEFALKLCLALGCEISPELIFSRKSYFYPDMAKNYQISQYEIPLGKKGKLKLKEGKEVGITRVHMEEDPASLVHPAGMKDSAYVLVDYNRSGNPLAEIVTEPDLESPEETRDFMKQLITVLEYLEIFDVNSGIIKADANISIKESGYTRVEIKNITGFKEIESALVYELNRQIGEAKNHRTIHHETRSWDSESGVTFSLRKKETEEDYGYIIDSDLTVVEIKNEWINKIKKGMPELAQDKVKNFVSNYRIKKEDAEIIAADKEMAKMFESVAKQVDANLAAKWIRRELVRVLNYNKKELNETGVNEKHIIALLKLIQNKKITDNIGQQIIEKLVENPFDVNEYVKKEKLEAVSDVSELEKYCREAIAENPNAVEDYRKGEAKALNFIVGSVMKKTKGKATPKEVNEIILKLIKL
ncbi:MAG TPA: Asp-tRNA(Asn)/Glu-tRNA(Gln) amidotransferase subunit GatB [Candidatus Nanoarchaeia archaeon]|nr:Asp-tRNA(Asn)/Glu-tRNA(Gln) amidotransferase subunit GatB [Candidatus Nanoarchaeia archaeon]